MGVVRQLFDGLTNALSGMGTTTDPRAYNRYFARIYSPQEIDAAYRGSWVMQKAISKPATEMVREWRDWQADSADIEKLEAEEKRLDLRNKIRSAEILRGLGGAGMVLYVDGDQTQPLDPAAIKAGGLKAIHVWHRSRFSLGEMITAWDDPWFGHPAFYEVQLQGATESTPTKFHPSRVVAFKAERVAEIVGGSWLDCFWGQSKVQSIIDAVQNVDTAETGFSALIKDARNRRLYIPKLTERFATADGEAQFARRAQALAAGESSLGITFLDAGNATGADGKATGGETLEDRQMVWAGIPDIMNAYRTAAAAAADMPVTVLWGTSPAGLNATGQSDLDLYDKMISGRQDLDLRPCMTQIDAALVPSALGKVDDSIWYEWAPLSSQSEKDEATTFYQTMQGLQILASLNLIPEVAMSKGTQNLLEERGWVPGLGDALAEIPEDERFMITSPADVDENGDPIDPSAIVTKGGGQQSGRVPVQPTEATARRRAANDALKAAGIDEATRATILDALEGEQGRPFDDGDVSGEPRDEHGRWTNGAAHTFIRRSLKSGQASRGHTLGEVEAALADKARALGHDLSGKTVTLDHSYTRHIIANHGDEREKLRGQVPITHGDLAAAHDILNGAHDVKVGHPATSRTGHGRIEATTHFAGHTYTTVAEVRKRTAMIVSMWKR